MKKLLSSLCMLLALALCLSVTAYAAGDNYDTLADWNIRIAVPDDTVAVLRGNEYYIYALREGSIPYVMLTTYRYSSVEKFVTDFTAYMQKQHEDLKVLAEAQEKTVGDKDCVEIDYGYKVSGYDVTDRRLVHYRDGIVYLFTSKEVKSRNLTVGDMLEQVVRDAVFLDESGAAPEPEDQELSAAYLYCREDGTPKYWVDLTGIMADTVVLHCYFRSGEPSFYETLYYLDLESADFRGDQIRFSKVTEVHGIDVSDWFLDLRLTLRENEAVLQVKRNEKTLAGGSEDNMLTGTYPMEPVNAGVYFTYSQDEGSQVLLEPHTYPACPGDGPFEAETLGRWSQIHYFVRHGFFPPEVDVQPDGDGYSVQLYEIVTQDGSSHTATSARYLLDAYGSGTDDITGEAVELCR